MILILPTLPAVAPILSPRKIFMSASFKHRLSVLRFISRLALCLGLSGIFSLELRAVTKSPDVASRVADALVQNKVDDRLKNLSSVGAHLANSEMNEALAVAETLKELRERAVFKEAALKHWSEIAPVEAFRSIAKLPEGRGKVEIVRTAAANFAKSDPSAASTAAEKMPAGRARNEAIGIVAEVWARLSIPDSLRWVKSLPVGAARETALYNIRFIWVHSDPATAAEDLQNLPPGDTRNALTMNIAGEWAAIDPVKAIDWARGLSSPGEQGLAYSNIAESWADRDPPAAVQFALALPVEFRTQAAVAAASRWATQDPRAAAGWAFAESEPAIQLRGVSEVLNVWAPTDPQASARWIASLEPGSKRDSAVQAYSEAAGDWAPEVVVKLVAEMSDPSTRQQRVEQAFPHWLETDPHAAAQWLEGSDFPAEVKRRWLATGNSP